LNASSSDEIKSVIRNTLSLGYTLIAADKIKTGEGVLLFSESIYKESQRLGIYQEDDINALREETFHTVLRKMSTEYATRLSNWKVKKSSL